MEDKRFYYQDQLDTIIEIAASELNVREFKTFLRHMYCEYYRQHEMLCDLEQSLPIKNKQKLNTLYGLSIKDIPDYMGTDSVKEDV